LQIRISIHAPTRGATFDDVVKHRPDRYFNPRPHAGGDHNRSAIIFTQCISIHAPTRGATSTIQASPGLLKYFNPRPHAGGDRLIHSAKTKNSLFQSTPPRGGRLECKIYPKPTYPFQSTPPRGGRLFFYNQIDDVSRYFNPRPHAGGDKDGRRQPSQRLHFNPRPHAGGDNAGGTIAIGDYVISIHAPTRGATFCHL